MNRNKLAKALLLGSGITTTVLGVTPVPASAAPPASNEGASASAFFSEDANELLTIATIAAAGALGVAATTRAYGRRTRAIEDAGRWTKATAQATQRLASAAEAENAASFARAAWSDVSKVKFNVEFRPGDPTQLPALRLKVDNGLNVPINALRINTLTVDSVSVLPIDGGEPRVVRNLQWWLEPGRDRALGAMCVNDVAPGETALGEWVPIINWKNEKRSWFEDLLEEGEYVSAAIVRPSSVEFNTDFANASLTRAHQNPWKLTYNDCEVGPYIPVGFTLG